MHPQAVDFIRIFEGFTQAHGVYNIEEQNETRSDGKVLGRAASVATSVSVELWDLHLQGRQGLGIIPINAESKCRFGAIDIDEYPLDLISLNKNIKDNKLPLILCRTKSGGAHLYIFLSEFIEAKIVQKKLREMASFLGYGSCEIFPRQSELIVSRGDAGNWINMPYFSADKTMRYALDKEGKAIKHVRDFIPYVERMMVSHVELMKLTFVAPETLAGGPPCLQQLVKNGFPEGTRNNGLFNLGVYLLKVNPDKMPEDLEKYNQRFMTPPLSSEEVLAVIKSVNKKEYGYTCKAQPIQSFCNAAICRTCKYGVGGADLGMPKMGTLTKLNTIPPIWFLDVETEAGGSRLELTTEDLQNPIKFQNRCMSVLNIMPLVLRRDNWTQVVAKLLSEVNVIDVPPEVTPQGQLLQHLDDFCTGRVQARTVDDILLGKPWTSESEIHFRLRDFMSYLDRQRFDEFKMNYVAMHIREIKGFRKTFHNIKGKGANVFVIPEPTFKKQNSGFETPKQPGQDAI